jgi:hypothetical protein
MMRLKNLIGRFYEMIGPSGKAVREKKDAYTQTMGIVRFHH